MVALKNNDTMGLVPFLHAHNPIGRKWVVKKSLTYMVVLESTRHNWLQNGIPLTFGWSNL